MTARFHRAALLGAAALLVSSVPVLALGTPSAPIYVDFKLKQDDNPAPIYFSILLDRDCAPRTAANFLGLASGLRPWVKPGTHTVEKTPFYTGTQIYRVVPGGEVCFGSPTNTTTGGPGYVVQDEALNSGNSIYYVFMDNDGPNTNGSRFFVSIPNQNLNSSYTRLGAVQIPTNPSGQNGRTNIFNISNVARNATTGKPTKNITIEQITYRGWSTTDPSFNVLVPQLNLPLVSNTGFDVVRSGSTWRLRWSKLGGSTATWLSSTNLQTWGTFPSSGFDLPGATVLGADITAQVLAAPRTFYRGAAVFYSQWPAATFSRADSILRFSYIDYNTNPLQYILLEFDYNTPGTGGNWYRTVNNVPQASGSFTSTYVVPKPFVGEMAVTPTSGTALKPFTFRLHFDHHLPTEGFPRIDRFQAFTTSPLPPFESHAGTWTYTFFPN